MQPLILPYGQTVPRIAASAWVAPGAVVIGDTLIADYATVLFNCVLRGDINRIEVGAGSNIQDLTMLHVADDWPCIIGREVTVGHCALLHGCVVEDGCLIGMGARVLNGAVIGRGSIVAAGALVPEGMVVPPGSLVAGLPAVVKGPVTEKHLIALGALEDAANESTSTEDLQGPFATEDLHGLPGFAFARKYRLVAQSYITGTAFRPNTDR